MKRRELVIDTETTSLFPDYKSGSGVVWEAAVIDRATGAEFCWRVKPDVSLADPEALRVGRYRERTVGMCRGCAPEGAPAVNLAGRNPDRGPEEWTSPQALADVLADMTEGAILWAANPAFDAGFLSALLKAHERVPAWHYRLRDIGSTAYGYLVATGQTGQPVPADAPTDWYALALGIDPAWFERHSALGDCRLVKTMLAVMEGDR